MSKSFTDLVTDVYSLTNRPDLVNETALAIRAATLKAHHSDFYPKDLFETGIQFGISDYQQSLDYVSLIPLWRSIKYIRKVDITTSPYTPGKFLDLISPEQSLDSYAQNKEDVYYLAGREIKIRSIDQQANYVVGCYVHPDVTVTGYNSWVANEHEFAIVYEATAIIFKTIGYDEQVSTYRQMVTEEYNMLRSSNLLAVGF